MTVVNEIEEVGSPKVDDFLEHFGIKGMHWGVRRAGGGSTGGATKSGSSSTETKTSDASVAPAKGSALNKHKIGSLRMNGTEFNRLSVAEKRQHMTKAKLKSYGIAAGAVTAYSLANDKYARHYMKQAAKALADPKRWLGTATLAKIAVKNVMANGRGKKVADKGLKAIGNLSVYALHQGANGSWG